MQMRGGYGTDASDGDHEAAVFFDADYGAFRSFKVSGNDAYSLSLAEFLKVFREVFKAVASGVCDEAKHVHLVV